jgi:hypothetical protein
MFALLSLCMPFAAVGCYEIQKSLERREQERHAND